MFSLASRLATRSLARQVSRRRPGAFPPALARLSPVALPGRHLHASSPLSADKGKVSVTFLRADGTELKATGKIGENLLDIVVDNELDIDGFGACEGTLACSTCHLVFEQKDFDNIPDEATDEELDMLDLAYGLTDTSRLGCQVCMTKELDGLVAKVPEGVNDQR